MKSKKTAKQLIEEANGLDVKVKAMDEHYREAAISGSMTDAQLEVHRRARNKMALESRVKRKAAAEMD